jgi:eukaryotic-like serine/threonine-protein kinase
MTSGPEMCAVCGTPRSGRLESNCPTCLMRLGTPSPEEEDHAGPVSSGLEAGGSGRIGDYDLVEEIAHGGMGIVYRAVQISLKREVALKLMLAAEFAKETARKRFHREAEAAAGLHHANIVSIYEIGEQAGRPYFSMELVEGRNLAELTRDKPLPARDVARIARTLAEAVQYAHEHGVLHRDLKPSNVLLDNLGEPHITDFGLAKQMEIGADLTMTGQVLGTPSYMPPEQAESKRGPTTAASDVYSLGAILYQLLTARPPFIAETLTQTLRLVVEGDPVSPRLLNPSVPRDLETICLKCLEKEPRSRYSTARELADELGRFLKHEPIRARSVGPPARLARWCRRKPSLALALGGIITLLLVLAIGSPIAIFRISRARNTAEAAQHETQAQLYSALLEQARATVRSGELGHRVRTLDAIRRAAAITNTAELRREAMAALALPELRFEREIPIGPGFTALQPDSFLESLARCRGSGPVEIISLGDGHLMATLPAAVLRICYLIKWSPDDRFLALKREPATPEETSWVEVWDVGNTNRVLLIENGDYQALAFHPRLPRLLGGKSDGGLTLWDVDERKELARFALPISIFDRASMKQAGGAALAQLAFSPHGERFAAAYFGQSNFLVSVHRCESGEMLWSSVFTNSVTDLDWDPTGRWIGASEDQGWVQLVDAKTGKYRTLGRHKLQGVSVAFSRDGAWLLSGGWERELIAWDTRTAERAFSVALDSFRAQFGADGMRCAMLTRKGCQIFSFEQPSACHQLNGLVRAQITHSAVSADNRWLAVSDAERLAVWDLAGDAPPAVTPGGYSSSVFFSAEGELFTSRDRGCARWRIEPPGRTGEAPRLRKLDFPFEGNARSICLLSNDVVETSGPGSRFMEINGRTDANDSWFPTVNGVNGASPNGRWLGIFEPYDDVLDVYAPPDFRLVAELTNQMAIRSFEFSPTADEIAVTGAAQVDVWNTKRWQRTQTLTNFMDLHFSPNSASAWWLTADFRSAGLYDRQTGHLLLPLPRSTLPLTVSPDGRFLVVSVEGRSLQVWNLAELRASLKNLGVDWTDR